MAMHAILLHASYMLRTCPVMCNKDASGDLSEPTIWFWMS